MYLESNCEETSGHLRDFVYVWIRTDNMTLIYPLNFLMYSTVLLTINTMMYKRSLGLIKRFWGGVFGHNVWFVEY